MKFTFHQPPMMFKSSTPILSTHTNFNSTINSFNSIHQQNLKPKENTISSSLPSPPLNMSKQNVKSSSHAKLQKHYKTTIAKTTKEHENPCNCFTLSKQYLKKVYPFITGLHKITYSTLSLSSSLSQTSDDDDSSLTDSSFTPLDQKISLALGLINQQERRCFPATTNARRQPIPPPRRNIPRPSSSEGDQVKRCNWITKNSDNIYVQFHDGCWGVPIYDDDQLFELLALSGMLMDFNWTKILKKRELLREAFGGFNINKVANMGKKEIQEIASNQALMLTNNKVRCIVGNAKCIVKIVSEYGSFSSYMWKFVGYKPIINRFKYQRNVPLKSPKAQAISRDLLRRGFRHVGPVIIYSFMQAAGMTIDHLVDCFRYNDCVNLAQTP